MIENIDNSNKSKKYLVAWLSCCAILIISMIILGGYTRLTNSGLSIVEWKPVTGVVPPLNENEWEIEFDKYKQFPEYKIVNKDMKLDEFKFIFLVEYFHRLLGRFLGLVFFIPFLYFSFSKKINPSHYVLIMLLGALQGFMGWYMVKSGLSKEPSVSHYRLSMHFIIAVFLYILIFRKIFKIMNFENIKNHGLNIGLNLLLILLILQMFMGGLVAGLDAGMIYDTFPLMGNSLVPKETNDIGFSMNLFNNPASVQFIHRKLGYFILIFAIFISYRLYKNKSYIKSLFVFVATLSQVLLGIFTILYNVPMLLGLLHQIFAIFLISVILWSSYEKK